MIYKLTLPNRSHVFLYDDSYGPTMKHYMKLVAALYADFGYIDPDDIEFRVHDSTHHYRANIPFIMASVPNDHPSLEHYIEGSPFGG